MKIISTRRSQVLAGRLASLLNIPLIDIRWQNFPDGEIYLRAAGNDSEIILVGSIVTSDDLIEILLLADTFADAHKTLVIPYMGYARQDKQFNAGEPLSARAVAAAAGRGMKEIITVNIHEDTVLDHFPVPARNVSQARSMGEFIKTLPCVSPLILGPDIGAAGLSRDIAGVGGWESDHLHKVRLSGEEVRIEPKSIPVKNRDVIIVDDIISTGGTQATAAKMLYEQGAASIHTVCVHGVFATGAYARLLSAGIRSVTCSDTIEQACSGYSAAAGIAETLHNR